MQLQSAILMQYKTHSVFFGLAKNAGNAHTIVIDTNLPFSRHACIMQGLGPMTESGINGLSLWTLQTARPGIMAELDFAVLTVQDCL